MEVILPFNTDTPYWNTDEGQQLHQFAQKLHLPQYNPRFPLSPNKTADLLNFSNTNFGKKKLLDWVNAGLVAPEEPIINGFSRSSILVFQRLKALANQRLSYKEASAKLAQDFEGSELKLLVGTLKSEAEKKILSVTLLDPHDPWFIQWEELTKLRSYGLILR